MSDSEIAIADVKAHIQHLTIRVLINKGIGLVKCDPVSDLPEIKNNRL